MAGNMLHDRDHAAVHETRRMGPRQRHDVFNMQAIGAVADHIMGIGLRHIQHWQAIGGNSNFNQVFGHEAAHVARRAQCREGTLCIEIAVGACWRVFPPVVGGRSQALNPPAFLIDKHGRVPAANGLAERRGEGFDLSGCFAIALEKNKTPGILFAKEGYLGRRQLRAFTPTNEAANFHDTNFWTALELLLANKTVAFTGSNQRAANFGGLVVRSQRTNSQAEPRAAANRGRIDCRWKGSNDAGVFCFQPAKLCGGFILRFE